MKIGILVLIFSSLSGRVSLCAQNCSLTCPENMVISADAGKEGTTVQYPKFNFPAECGTITYSPASGSFMRLGAHSVIVMSSTGQKCSFTVNVTDNEPPVLSDLVLNRQNIWPASNKMKKVGVSYTAKDNGVDVKTEMTVGSNATDGIRDWEITDNHNIRLKASRLPDGSPRIYTITVTAKDEAGNKTVKTTTIAVSQSMTAVKK